MRTLIPILAVFLMIITSIVILIIGLVLLGHKGNHKFDTPAKGSKVSQ
jgi:preprotein translocase subunit SecG